MTSVPFRCGYVALAGMPNVGKSTLLNALVGLRLSIVSSKAQTTRERVTGILTSEHFQILFIDAPGIFEPRNPLQESMHLAATAAIDDADVVVYVADATRETTLSREEVFARVAGPTPVILAVNKIDSLDEIGRDGVSQLIDKKGLRALKLSAITGEGLTELVDELVPLLPESPPLFPIDDTAAQPLRFFAAEYVRETCLEQFREEVPYSITCQVDEFREEQDPIYIRVVIYVERESQKGVVIGRGGCTIKRVGEIARKRIEELVERQVYLDLRVKVLPGWTRKRERLRRLGFILPGKAGGGQNGP